jgi:hypothetical protein
MSTKDLSSLKLDELALEPIDPKLPSKEQPLTGRAQFTPNTRNRTDRRKGGDRRQTLRFEPDRRTGKDRRPETTWINGKNS